MRHPSLPFVTALVAAAALAPAAGAMPAPPDRPIAPDSSYEQVVVPSQGGGDHGLDAGWIVAICGGAAAAGAAAGFAGARVRVHHTAARPS
jgi:hypothetical protein